MKIERPMYCPRCDLTHTLTLDLPNLVSAEIGTMTLPCPSCGLVLVAAAGEIARGIEPSMSEAELEYIKRKATQMAAESGYSGAQWMDILLTFRRDINLFKGVPAAQPLKLAEE